MKIDKSTAGLLLVTVFAGHVPMANAFNKSVTTTRTVDLKVISDEAFHSSTPIDDLEAIPDDVMPSSCTCIGGFNGRYTLSCPHDCESCHENQLCGLHSNVFVFKDPDCSEPYDQGFGGIEVSSLLVLALLFRARFDE